MTRCWGLVGGVLALALSVALAAPLLATTAEGVRKWRAGDWAGAVAAWTQPAAAGDPDALFNMGQAYRLGRGVPKNVDLAIDFYRRASARGHVAGTANLGITLFQEGRRAEALGPLRAAADKGDARAAYVLGLATFSGEGAPRNQALGLAYVMRARDLGLDLAGPQVARLSGLVGEADRARAEAAARALAMGEPVPVAIAGVTTPPPFSAAELPPERQGQADASEDLAEAPSPAPAAPVAPAAPPASAGARPSPAAPGARTWHVQLGAYASESAARVAWATLVAQAADLLVGKAPIYQARGGLVRLQVGPFADRADAQALCAELSAAGRPCFVTSG
ncbi:SPOR domain-containing protein [Thermaurantiacus sp.]